VAFLALPNIYEGREMKDNPSLVLGTVQLGLKYGVANQSGKPSQGESNSIVRAAWENGIEEFDTAQGYGASEEVLGNAFKELKISSKVKVISKLSPHFCHTDSKGICNSIDNSLKKLTISRLFCLMLHREEQLENWNEGLAELLQNFKNTKKVQHLGVSVYSPLKALEAINTVGIDFIQLPMNVLERRFERLNIFREAQEKGKQIYIRSAFLQGLLLMSSEELPAKLQHAKITLNVLQELCDRLKLTKQELALGYLKLNTSGAKIVFGAEDVKQVQSNVNVWNKNYSEDIISEIQQSFENVDEKILNPCRWNL
jgi:aryl-alcohol dehydrogenase-like predicted oxidoreductase